MAERLPTVGTPSLLRAINARTILERIQRSGPVSRAQVARDSGLSKPTVSLGLTALLDAGLVREVGRSSGRPGPSAVLYELNPAAGWVVGVDVGRRRVRAALADITGAVAGRRDEQARASSARALIGQLGAIAHALAAEAGIGWDQVHQVTVGSPGVFEPVRGAVTLAPNLPGWGRQGLLAALREELGDRIGVENDVNLAAEGERWRGLGRGVRNFGFLSVGTGVGMGLVLDGRLYRGAGGAAGEVGYLPVGADPYDRQVRRRGAFEESVNGAAVVRRAAEAGLPGSLTAKKIFALARRGDPLAREVVEEEARILALGLAVVTAVVDLLALALLAAACTAGGGGSEKPAATIDPNANHAPLTLTVWSNFSARELGVTTAALKTVTQKYPWMTVKHVGSKDDQAISRAINGGTPPDVAISFTPDNAARFCDTGAWQDLTPYLASSKVDKAQVWPAGVFSYTSFENKQCALPMLTDAFGLYYNTDLFKKAGISAPPKTTTELADMAKKLTEYNPDGSIKVLGFLPLIGLYGPTSVNTLGHAYGAKWYDDALKPTLGSDPNWAKMLTWQKAMVDAVGYDKLQKFAAEMGGANSEFSAQNGFETGKIAMMMDGEWRNAFIEGDKSKVNYGTAPFPVDPDQPGLYGSGQIGGTIAGVPKGVKHAAESWLLLQFMTTDNTYLTTIAHGLKNVPSTVESLKDQQLQNDPHFKPFLDVFANQQSTFKPITPIGVTDFDLFQSFAQKWQAGKVPDLQAGLKQLDDQISKQLQLG